MQGRIEAAVCGAVLLAMAGVAWGGGFPFWEPTLRDIATESAAIELADFSEDGVLDLLVIQGTNTGYALVYEGNGDGSFPPQPTDQASLYLRSNGGIAGDFNGDGVLDIAALNSACST
ncbi:MAG: VCBS repeat-containing protein [Planctomycetes bacterium]|nr:VCBS repeat-containing protein [Planctomycetota bacterium]